MLIRTMLNKLKKFLKNHYWTKFKINLILKKTKHSLNSFSPFFYSRMWIPSKSSSDQALKTFLELFKNKSYGNFLTSIFHFSAFYPRNPHKKGYLWSNSWVSYQNKTKKPKNRFKKCCIQNTSSTFWKEDHLIFQNKLNF
jgi:hypothetical protein